MKNIKRKDAETDRQIHVTSEDFKHSVCKDHAQCVVARAIKRQTGAEWVDVANSTVLIKRRGSVKVSRYLLDKVAREQVAYFDEKRAFAPCLVVLKAPKGTQKLSYRPRHDESKPHSGPSHYKRKEPTR